LTDYITDYGGYRADTVKHTEESVGAGFQNNAIMRLTMENNPTKVLDNNSFYTIAEVYNYNISSGKIFDFETKVTTTPMDSTI
jgi:alpha-amylase